MKKHQYIQPICGVIEISGAIIMTHVSAEGKVSSSGEYDDPVNAW